MTRPDKFKEMPRLTFMQRDRSTPDHERHCAGVPPPKGLRSRKILMASDRET